MIHTTFALAKKSRACIESYHKMGEALGGITKYGEDTPIPLDKVLEVLGLKDTIWSLRCTIEPSENLIIEFACQCAEHVLHFYTDKYPGDNRPQRAIDAARLCLTGKSPAARAAGNAARAAGNVAGNAAWAARDAARAAGNAAWAAGDAARAAGNAAWAAARAAGNVAGDAARAAGNVAGNAAWAAGNAAWAAGNAAWAAGNAAWAAGNAAETKWQTETLLTLLKDYQEVAK